MKTEGQSVASSLASAKQELEKRHSKSTTELYEEREKRIMDAIRMTQPDRVPVAMYGGYFPLYYVGIQPSTIFYDLDQYKKAVIRTLLDFEPDIYRGTILNDVNGPALEMFDPKQYRWPGGNVPATYGQQFVEMEVMKENEYPLFITDPTDFMLRYYLPRTCGSLEPFSKIPSLGPSLAGNIPRMFYLTPMLAGPGARSVLDKLATIGRMQQPFTNWEVLIQDMGYAPFWYAGWSGGPPFDWIANYLRGMQGIMKDMFRQPDKLLAACERIYEWRVARAVAPVPGIPEYNKRVLGGAFHFSSDAFITKKQFERFSWPTWKKELLLAIELGWIPFIWCEGKCDDRIEYFLELPKRKFYVGFEQADMTRAKAILGDHCCICGDVRSSLLTAGSAQDVEDYCRKLIETCGKNGGFILMTASSAEAAKPANVKAMIDSVEKFGRY